MVVHIVNYGIIKKYNKFRFFNHRLLTNSDKYVIIE